MGRVLRGRCSGSAAAGVVAAEIHRPHPPCCMAESIQLLIYEQGG